MPKLTQKEVRKAFLEDSDYLATGESYADLQVKLAKQRMDQALKGNDPAEMMNASKSFLITLQTRDITNRLLASRRMGSSSISSHL